jgi:hypothetical protein
VRICEVGTSQAGVSVVDSVENWESQKNGKGAPAGLGRIRKGRNKDGGQSTTGRYWTELAKVSNEAEGCRSWVWQVRKSRELAERAAVQAGADCQWEPVRPTVAWFLSYKRDSAATQVEPLRATMISR